MNEWHLCCEKLRGNFNAFNDLTCPSPSQPHGFASPVIAQQQLCPDCSDLYLKTSTGAKCERAVGDTTGSGDTDSFTPRVRSDKRSIIILLGKTLDRYLTKYYDGSSFIPVDFIDWAGVP